MPKRKRMGRPPIPIDLETLEKLAMLQCTDTEIAAFFGVHKDTISDRQMKDSHFADIIKNGREKGTMSLRRKQVEVALAGNVGMLIWLGKQYLHQRETYDIPVQPINISVDLNDVRERFLGELDRLAARTAKKETVQ